MIEGIKNRDRTYAKKMFDNLNTIDQNTNKTVYYIDVDKLDHAPIEWNFFDPLNDQKMYELIDSIQENGLLFPIILWQKVDGRYMILAGHNRVEAFKKLYAFTKDSVFLKMPAFVYQPREITAEQAKTIVIDTNYVQRSLSVKEKAKSVMFKYTQVEQRKDRKGKTRDLVAEELGISSRSVGNYKRLEKLISEIRDMVYDGKISLRSALNLTNLSSETQEWLYVTHSEQIINKIANKMKEYMRKEDVERLIEKEKDKEEISVSIRVPKELESQFREMAKQWIETNKN